MRLSNEYQELVNTLARGLCVTSDGSTTGVTKLYTVRIIYADETRQVFMIHVQCVRVPLAKELEFRPERVVVDGKQVIPTVVRLVCDEGNLDFSLAGLTIQPKVEGLTVTNGSVSVVFEEVRRG